GIAALDDDDRILLIQQYRHPIATRDWEVPAGLRDVAGEAPWRTAARELGEEADLQARDWWTLADLAPTPGGSSELIRIYLARVPRWVRLDGAVESALAGSVRNAAAQLAILHADHARRRGFTGLRPSDDPWPAVPAPYRT